jgi:uncharacterized damage-inducible protein DinB
VNELGTAFIARAQYHLLDDFLPKIDRSVNLLTEEQIWWRANPESNSIGNLLLHLSGNVRQWIISGLGGATDARQRDTEFAQKEIISRDELCNRLKQTVTEAADVLGMLDTDQLLEKRTIQGFDVTMLEAILHVVEHFSMHTGQIILLAKQMTAKDMRFHNL